MSLQPNDPVLNITQSILTEAAQRPWLATLLMRRKPDWLTRLAHLAQRIRHLPNHTRRALRRKLTAGLAAAALLLALAGTPTAQADSTIIVDGTNCTLAEAIISANADNAAGSGCTNGSGVDTLDLQTNVTLSAAVDMITSPIILEGNGFTIDGNDAYRVLNVGNTGNLTLRNATITGGRADIGGGLRNDGTLTVIDSTITYNTATDPTYGGNGGGLANYGDLTVTGSTISHNQAVYVSGYSYGYGGGLLLGGAGTVTIDHSTLSDNTADRHGGGIALMASSSVTINASTLSGNQAFSGGGFYANLGDTAIHNSTFSGNVATGEGGGLHLAGGLHTLYNTTITGNTAGGESGGGGIWLDGNAATVTLGRSIVSGNTASRGSEIRQTGTEALYADDLNLFGHSGEASVDASDGFTPGTNDFNATSDGDGTSTHVPTALTAILATTLANNGTQPHPFTHALVSGSPAIDKISKATCDAAPVNGVDERGGVRAGGTVAEDERGGTACDIGAFEFATVKPNAITLRDLTATTPSSGVIGLIGAGLAAFGALVIGLRKTAAKRPSN